MCPFLHCVVLRTEVIWRTRQIESKARESTLTRVLKNLDPITRANHSSTSSEANNILVRVADERKEAAAGAVKDPNPRI